MPILKSTVKILHKFYICKFWSNILTFLRYGKHILTYWKIHTLCAFFNISPTPHFPETLPREWAVGYPHPINAQTNTFFTFNTFQGGYTLYIIYILLIPYPLTPYTKVSSHPQTACARTAKSVNYAKSDNTSRTLPSLGRENDTPFAYVTKKQ